MRLIEWEVAEDGYEEQIIIPKEKRELAAEEGIGTENKQKVTVQIMNLKTGESYIGRLAITGNRQTRLPQQVPPAKPAPYLHDTQQWRSAERGIQGTSGQVYLPTEIQKMLKDSGTVRIQILGG